MRKVYCNIVEGVTYEDRCIFALSQVIEGNPNCENCILRELKRLKRCGIRAVEAGPTQKNKIDRKKKSKTRNKAPGNTKHAFSASENTKDEKKSGDAKEPKGPKDTKDTKDTFDVRFLAKLIGRSVRRTQELAKEGKIPARKQGRYWHFDKQEIDQWLKKREDASNGISIKQEKASPGSGDGELKKCNDVVYTTNHPDQGEEKTQTPPRRDIEGEEANNHSGQDLAERMEGK